MELTYCYDYNGFEVRLKLKGDVNERYELEKEFRSRIKCFVGELLGLSTHSHEENALNYIKETPLYKYLLTMNVEVVYCDRYEPIVELIDMYKVINENKNEIN